MRYCLHGGLFAIVFFFASMSIAADNVIVRYLQTNDIKLQPIAKKLQSDSSIQDVITLMNEEFTFSKPLTIIFGANDGPLYDPARNDILIPYTFLDDVEQRFNAVGYPDDNQDKTNLDNLTQAVMDVVIHTLFHELAHALIATYELPIVGREEDAADNLAVVLSIEYFENGAEIAISAAELFYLEGDEITEFDEADFWDEHSLDLQCYYATLCHVYGSDDTQYTYLLEEAGFSDEHGELCISDYERMANNWLTLLAAYLSPEVEANTSDK